MRILLIVKMLTDDLTMFFSPPSDNTGQGTDLLDVKLEVNSQL